MMSLFVRPRAVLSMHILIGTFCVSVRSQFVLSNTALLFQCELIKKKKEKRIIYIRTPDRSWGTAVKTYD